MSGSTEEVPTRTEQLRVGLGQLAVAIGVGVIGGYLLMAVLLRLAMIVGEDLLNAIAGEISGREFGTVDYSAARIVDVLAVCFGVYVAGRLAMAESPEYPNPLSPRTRRIIAVVGYALLLVVILFMWVDRFMAATVVAMLSIPLFWVVGAMQYKPMRRIPGRAAMALGGLAILCFSFSVSAGWYWPSAGTYQSLEERYAMHQRIDTWDHRYDRIALPVPQEIAAATPFPSVTGRFGRSLNLVFMDRSVLDGWTDLRVEVWRTIDFSQGGTSTVDDAFWVVDPAQSKPLLLGQAGWLPGFVTPDGSDLNPNITKAGARPAMLSGTVHPRPTGGVGRQDLVLAMTGIGPDGHRHLLDEPQQTMVWFEGSVWEWLGAMLSGQ